MPTRRGRSLVVVALLLALAGRLFAMVELFALAAAAGALVAGAVAYVNLRRFRVALGRRLLPARATAGGSVMVEVSAANEGRRRTPVVEATDGAGRAELAPLAPGETGRWRYRLATPHRGIVGVGPAALRLTDPFGVASRRGPQLDAGSLVVHPWSEAVVPPPRPAGRRGRGPAAGAAAAVDPGEFHALAPYQHGDDLRRVHWPTAARLDELVVRHDEAPCPWHCVVVLDLRVDAHDSVTAEAAISATAGVARACMDDEGLVRVVTTGGFDSGLAGGAAHLESVLDALAAARADQAPGLAGAAAVLGPSFDARTLVVVSGGRLGPADLAALGTARGPADTLVAVRLLPGGAGGGGGGVVGFVSAGMGGAAVPALAADHVVDVAAGTGFGRAWDAAFDDAFDHTLARR